MRPEPGIQREGMASGRRRWRVAGPGWASRRGSIYLFVLIIAMLVSVVGVSAITLCRVNIRRTQAAADNGEARSLAGSAVEAAIAAVNADANWRSHHLSGQETPQLAFGAGTLSWRLIDADGDLSDDPSDPVRVLGTGRAGQSVWVYGAMLNYTTPLDALRTCIHCAGQFSIMNGRSLIADGAPASTNADLYMEDNSFLYGDVEAASRTGSQGTVTGTETIPASPKALPGANVIANYIAKATALPYNGDFDRVVLSPVVNEYGGGLNADGVYFLSSGGHDLTIHSSRIHGTLVLDVGGNKLVIDRQVSIEPYRTDCPTLIVVGDADLEYTSAGAYGDRYLQESAVGHNFNPPGAPYEGQSDSDTDDAYPSQISGLVHIAGNLKLGQSAFVQGTILCGGSAVVEGDCRITYDPAIAASPPLGYADPASPLAVTSGSWRREPAN